MRIRARQPVVRLGRIRPQRDRLLQHRRALLPLQTLPAPARPSGSTPPHTSDRPMIAAWSRRSACRDPASPSAHGGWPPPHTLSSPGCRDASARTHKSPHIPRSPPSASRLQLRPSRSATDRIVRIGLQQTGKHLNRRLVVALPVVGDSRGHPEVRARRVLAPRQNSRPRIASAHVQCRSSSVVNA